MLVGNKGLSREEMTRIIEDNRPDAFCIRFDDKREKKLPISENTLQNFLDFCERIGIIYTEKLKDKKLYYRIKEFDDSLLEEVLAPKIPTYFVENGWPNLDDIVRYLKDCCDGKNQPAPKCFTSDEIWKRAGIFGGKEREIPTPEDFKKCLIILQGIGQLTYWRKWLYTPPEK